MNWQVQLFGLVLLVCIATGVWSCNEYLQRLLKAEDTTRRALLTELMKVREAAERGNRR